MLILSHILSLTSSPLSCLIMLVQMAFIPDWMVSDLSCTVEARLGLLEPVSVLTLGHLTPDPIRPPPSPTPAPAPAPVTPATPPGYPPTAGPPAPGY